MSAKKISKWDAFGKEVIAGRERRGWLQADLAKRLEVGQQTISRWEIGASRPRLSMLATLAKILPDHSYEDWRALAGYTPPTLTAVNPPLLPELPLYSLHEDRFEDFCRDVFAKKYPEASVNRVGGKGDTQHGIDIEVNFSDGKRYGFQCKRHQKFGKEKVKTAIRELKTKVDKAVIVLTRPATADARSGLQKSRKWEIWDSPEISRIVRHDLRTDDSCKIVDTYFPGLRKGFLGIDDPSPFLSTERFFAPFAGHRIFSHAWTLVGRGEIVNNICAMLQEDPRAAVIFHGSGGIGKSRIVKALCEQFQKNNPSVAVKIVDPSAEVSPSDFGRLQGGETLLVIEDAHDRTDLDILFGLSARSIEHPVRLLIVTRPFSLELIKRKLSRLIPLDEQKVVAVQKLKKSEVIELAKEILEKLSAPISEAEKIAEVTSDSPLATVIGAYLVGTKRVNPVVLNNHEEFRTELFKSFEEAITGELSKTEQPELVRDILGLIAIVQPVDIEHPEFKLLAERIVEKPIHKILPVVNRLYESGVVLKRGRRLRITPDLLGEYVVEDRCVVPLTGSSTGFAENVTSIISADLLHHVIVNVSRLDWRVSQSSRATSGVLDPLWRLLLQRYEQGDESKSAILQAISEAAVFQPKRALDFYDRVQEQGRVASRELTKLLKRVAYTYEYLDAACKRLWEIGRDDSRTLNQHPEHAIRILCELAQVEPNKPLEYCNGALDFALSALRIPSNHSYSYSLFEIVEAVLKTDGHQTFSKGYTVTLKRFHVRFGAVKAMRQKAISSIFEYIREGNTPSAVRAARSLGEAVRYPMDGDLESRKQWGEEFVETIKHVKEVFQSDGLDPIVTLELQKSINWHKVYGDEPTQSVAIAAENAINRDLKYKVTLNILDQWGHLRELLREDYEATQKRIQSEADATATELLSGRSVQEVAAYLEERFDAIRRLRINGQANTGFFVAKLIEKNVAVGEQIWENALAGDTQYPLINTLDGVLGAMIGVDLASCMSITHRALGTGRVELARAISFAYGWRGRNSRQCNEEEIDVIASLLRHEDVNCVFGCIRALENIASSNVGRAVTLLLTIDFTKEKSLVHECFMILMHNKDFLRVIKEEKIFEAILNKLLNVDEIEDYWVTGFIREGSRNFPLTTFNFLLKRIEQERQLRQEDSRGYVSIPWQWGEDAQLKFRESPSFEQILSRLVLWMKGKKDWATTEHGAVLFAAASGAYDELTLNTLSPLLFSSDPEVVEAASQMLSKAPRDFVFSNSMFVVKLLTHGHLLGSEVFKAVSSHLWSSVISGVRHGTPGQPYPEDVAMKENAEKMMHLLPKKSPAWEFFSGLKGQAESFINSKWSDDIVDFDGDE